MTPSGNTRQYKSIFISVASFCDPMLVFTLGSAVEKARHPGRLSFGIVDQNTVSLEDDLPQGAGRYAYLHIEPHQSRGACWARALAMTLYGGEDYFLQIDSHMLFDQDWDDVLIEALEAIPARSGNGKTILSTRPFAFEMEDDGGIVTKRFTDNTVKLVAKETVIRRCDPVIKFSGFNSKYSEDLPGFQISAAFVFTRGHFVEEVPYDPFFYFHGEEQNISIRAFSHGWDIWHPNAAPVYHLYKKRAEGEAPLHWDAQFEARRAEKWVKLRARARSRLADLIDGKLTGAYGLGNVRTVADYLAVSDLTLEDDWSRQAAAPIAPGAMNIEQIPQADEIAPTAVHDNTAQDIPMTSTTAAAAKTTPALPNGATSLNEAYHDWTVAGAQTAKGAAFVMSQQQRKRDTNQLVLATEFNDVAADTVRGTIILPFGIRLADGVSMQVDEGPRSKAFAFATALPAGIALPLSFDSQTVKALRAGKVLKLHAKAFDSGQNVLLTISLNGFAQAQDRIVALRRG